MSSDIRFDQAQVREMKPAELKATSLIWNELKTLPFEEALSVLINIQVSVARSTEMPLELLVKCVTATWEAAVAYELSESQREGRS